MKIKISFLLIMKNFRSLYRQIFGILRLVLHFSVSLIKIQYVAPLKFKKDTNIKILLRCEQGTI